MRSFSDHVERLFKEPEGEFGGLLHGVIGLSGEAGELLDAVKKAWVYGKPLDESNLVEEIGDVLFYLEAIAQQVGVTLEYCKEQNKYKLGKRYPEGYTDEAAINRLDKQ